MYSPRFWFQVDGIDFGHNSPETKKNRCLACECLGMFCTKICIEYSNEFLSRIFQCRKRCDLGMNLKDYLVIFFLNLRRQVYPKE